MRFDLPSDTQDLADGVRKLAVALVERQAPDPQVYGALADMGVFDLLGKESPDSDNGHVNTVVVVEQLARAGLVGPFSETIRAGAVGELVSSPAPVRDGHARLVRYGARVSRVLTAEGLVPLGATRPAEMKLTRDHLWVESVGAGLEETEPGYVWRTAAAETLGHLETGLARAVEHAKSRVQFKRPIATFQAVQFRLAECRWRLSGLQLLVREAAWRADREDTRADAISALAWLHARTVGRAVTAHVHQVFGAVGFTDELGLVRHTGATTMLRSTIDPRHAARLVRKTRLPAGAVPPSTTLAGFAR
jgi:alkylation response protein AidB-like acyl-CoA dehydrogenase